MKFFFYCMGVLAACCFGWADALPVITGQPTNQLVSPGATATFAVTASNVTGYQWKYNGSNIPYATNALLQIPNVQTNNTGYYMVLVKNSTGWSPSTLAYLATGLSLLDPNQATVPFSNQNIPSAQVKNIFNQPIATGVAMVEVGPQLDQMQSVPQYTTPVNNGYFNGDVGFAPSVLPGQTVYYRVDVVYTNQGVARTQFSTPLKLIATKYPDLADASGIKFPVWPEWGQDPSPWGILTPTNQTRLTGETVTLTNEFFGYTDFGPPQGQWRKDGVLLPNGTNFTQTAFDSFRAILTISNVQPADAGVYDVQMLGNNWIIGPKTSLSVEMASGNSTTILSPRWGGTNFAADLQGLAGRNYSLQWSSNLTDWITLQTILNTTGTTTFSNAPGNSKGFYRALLLP